MREVREELDEAFCKNRMIEMLAAFDQFCERHDLTYFLSWGTLIGAVRHKGFIPWDDDIDLSMPREDYDRLVQLSKIWDIPYNFLCLETVPDYPNYFGKLCDRETLLENFYMEDIPGMGLFIDIFPMDDVDINENDCAKLQGKLQGMDKMLKLSSMKRFWPSKSPLKSVVKYGMYRIAKMKGVRYWRDKLEGIIKQSASVQHKQCDYCVCGAIVLSKKWFEETVKLEFEGLQLSAPKEYDSFLRHYYDDYTVLPSPEERISAHDHKVYKNG